jgi:hypothetical protein
VVSAFAMGKAFGLAAATPGREMLNRNQHYLTTPPFDIIGLSELQQFGTW